MDNIAAIGRTAASAMEAQSHRMRIAAENIANADSTGTTPGSDPYRRKTITFSEEMDAASGANRVKVESVSTDPSPFQMRYDPSHPAADANGMVKMPNVNAVVEMADSREAARSFEANMNMMDAGRKMRAMLNGMLD